MSFQITPSHVAILVPSVRKAAEYLSRFGFQIGAEEVWEGEGTLEIYVEKDKANSLLLMEPIKPGAYQRALEKRGPGLHHLAIDVMDLEGYIDSLCGSGWLLHPKSVQSMKQFQTAYLARPGFPGLVEVHERAKLSEAPLFVEQVLLPLNTALLGLLKTIGLNTVVRTSAASGLVLGGNSLLLKELF